MFSFDVDIATKFDIKTCFFVTRCLSIYPIIKTTTQY